MSETVKTWSEWLKNSRFSYMTEEQKEQTLRWLFAVRDKILDRACLKPNDTLIDIGTGTGLLAFGAYDRLKESGRTIASDKYIDCLNESRKIAEECGITQNFEILESEATDIKLSDNSVDVVVFRSVLVHVLDKATVINEAYRILKPGGRISFFEPIIRSNTRYYELINPVNFPNYEKLKDAEYKIMTSQDDPLTNFDDKSLINNLEEAGFTSIDLDLSTEQSIYKVQEEMIDPWFNTPPRPGSLTMKEKFLQYLGEDEVNDFLSMLKQELSGNEITVKSYAAYISAQKI